MISNRIISLSTAYFIILLLALPHLLQAQQYVRIENRWQPDGKTHYQIHNQTGKIAAGGTEAGWWSAQWVFVPVPGTEYYQIQNRWKTNEYLHNQNGPIESGAITKGWWSAQWKLQKIQGTEFYKIQNRWKPTLFLHIQNQKIEVGAIQANWWSAHWKLIGFKSAGVTTPTTSSVSPTAWITYNYAKLQNKPLNQLVLPGSHDTGTHNLSSTWNRGVNDPFAPDTDDRKRGLSLLGEGYDKWAKAQERSIFQQLEDGIRYLDIRVCVDKSGNLKTCHGLYGVSLAEVINDVVKFTNKYPKEPVFLDFNHFYDWDEKSRNGKDNDAGYQGIRTSKLTELANMIEKTIGPRLAPNSLKPTSTLKQLVDTGRPLIVFWDKPLSGSFQSKYFWGTTPKNLLPSSYSGEIREIRNDKINHTDKWIRSHQNISTFSIIAAQISPSNDLYKNSYDFTGTYPFGLEKIAKESNPVMLSYFANEWKNYKHNIIMVDFYNQSGLVELCKQLNGLPANPKGVSIADRNKSTWGKWKLGAGELFAGSADSEWRVEIDACHSDLDNTDTGARITVQFWAGSERVASKYSDGVSSGCKVWEGNATFKTQTSRTITHVIVKTNGGDAFYIDELYLYKGGDLKQHHGRDDGSGWCLSTEAGDANGSWSGKVAGNTCKTEHRFNY